MAPPPGTMRVSRYFVALGLILGLLYLIVFLPGTGTNTPKLGIDLVGGVRVIFTAVPTGGGQVTQTAMDQARQIIEDRINGSGVTASTVQIQGDDQLVVSIPGGTDTDVAALGRAAQLNFRPVIAPAVPVGCDTKKKAVTNVPTSSSSGASAASSAPSSASAPAPGQPPSVSSVPRATSAPSGAQSSAQSGNAFSARKLAPAATTATTPAATRAVTTPAATTAAPTSSAGSAAPTGSGAAPSPSASSSQPAPACIVDPIKVLRQADKTLKMPTTEAEYDALTTTQQQGIAQALATFNCDTARQQNDDRNSYYIACEKQGSQSFAYLLGKVILRGTQVDEANAIAPSTGGQGGSTTWTVALSLDSSGQEVWGNWTKAHNAGSTSASAGGATQCGKAAQAQGGSGTPCSDFVAFTLDGAVVSAPVTQGPIIGKTTEVSGNFTQTSANELADQLKFGALPLNFRTDSNERVSASLGTSQLKAALLAGGIGLVLVVVYSLLYYRGLGLVTIASLIVSGLLTYAMMVILGQQIGFTLDLAGIAGLIVALGITADSFVVFFERIKDEVHEGRSVRVAVPRGWVRARRTVISADVVSFLAALILYIFASADVKGFAFTLGLSTILDLFVVVVFTHPIVALLSRSRAFGSPRFTGLNSVRAGGITQDTERPRGKLAARSQGGSAAERAAARRGSTAVAERPSDAPEPEPELEPDDDGAQAAPDEPKAGKPPAGGTAAERAAARRARQRKQRDEEGE